jgi:hypothetical protein
MTLMNTDHATTTAHEWKPLERFLTELDLEGRSPTRRADLARIHRWIVRHEIPVRYLGRVRLIDAAAARRVLAAGG